MSAAQAGAKDDGAQRTCRRLTKPGSLC